MTDNNDMLNLGRRGQMFADITYLMIKGAGYAAAFVIGIWVVLAVMAWFGRVALPEESRLTRDPAPQEFIDFADRVAEEQAARRMAPMAEEPAADDAGDAAADDAEEAVSE